MRILWQIKGAMGCMFMQLTVFCKRCSIWVQSSFLYMCKVWKWNQTGPLQPPPPAPTSGRSVEVEDEAAPPACRRLPRPPPLFAQVVKCAWSYVLVASIKHASNYPSFHDITACIGDGSDSPMPAAFQEAWVYCTISYSNRAFLCISCSFQYYVYRMIRERPWRPVRPVT